MRLVLPLFVAKPSLLAFRRPPRRSLRRSLAPPGSLSAFFRYVSKMPGERTLARNVTILDPRMEQKIYRSSWTFLHRTGYASIAVWISTQDPFVVVALSLHSSFFLMPLVRSRALSVSSAHRGGRGRARLFLPRSSLSQDPGSIWHEKILC